MPKQTLQTSLDQLREQLADAHSLDAETRQKLADVAETIEDVLAAPAPDYQQAHESVQSVALEFEARHPRFARILSEVTDALAKLGF
jgi:hypothetical protein